MNMTNYTALKYTFKHL